MIANTIGKTVNYVLEEEREKPESEQTTWHLRTLPKKAVAVIQDNLVGYDVTGSIVVSRPGTGALTAVKLGLAGWDNFVDIDGNEVRPHTINTKSGRGATGGSLPALSPKSLDLIPQRAIDELGGKIMEINGLTDEAEPEEAEDEHSAEDPIEKSATGTGSSSPQPSQPATPSKPTASSGSSAPAQLARA